MYLSNTAPGVPVTFPSISTTKICNSSSLPPMPLAYKEVPGRGATLIHFTPGRYSRSEYSVLTAEIATAVELVS